MDIWNWNLYGISNLDNFKYQILALQNQNVADTK